MGSTFGRLFRVTTFGESHGPGVGVVVDGMPPGLRVAPEDVQGLDRSIRQSQRSMRSVEKESERPIEELRRIINAAAVRRDPNAAWEACEMHIVRAGKLAIIEYEQRTKAFQTATMSAVIAALVGRCQPGRHRQRDRRYGAVHSKESKT